MAPPLDLGLGVIIKSPLLFHVESNRGRRGIRAQTARGGGRAGGCFGEGRPDGVRVEWLWWRMRWEFGERDGVADVWERIMSS